MTKEDTSGFYKFDGEYWFFTPNAVYNSDFILLKEEKEKYNYPVNGWYWYPESPKEYIIWKEEMKNENIY